MDLNVFYTWPLNRDYQCNQDLMMATAKKSGRFKTWLDGDEDQIQAIWQLVDSAGMSHELFTAIECAITPINGQSWLNWQWQADTPEDDATAVVSDIVARSNNLNQSLQWEAPDLGLVDIVPQSVIDAGNQTFGTLTAGENGLAFLPYDFTTTWAGFYPTALDENINGQANYFDIISGALFRLLDWSGSIDDAVGGMGDGPATAIKSAVSKLTTSTKWQNTPDHGWINLVSTFAPKPYYEGQITTNTTSKTTSNQTKTVTPSTNPNNSPGVQFDDSQSSDNGYQTTTDGDGQPPLGDSDGDTSLHNGGVPLNPGEISYFALNEGWAQPKGIGLGDIGKLTLGNRSTYAVYGDNHGDMALTAIHAEISVAAHARLKGVSVSSVNPDLDSLKGVHFQIWPGSKKNLGSSFTQDMINTIGEKLSKNGNIKTTQNPTTTTSTTQPRSGSWPSSIDPNMTSGTLTASQISDMAAYMMSKVSSQAYNTQDDWVKIINKESSGQVNAYNGYAYGLFQLWTGHWPQGESFSGSTLQRQTQLAIQVANTQNIKNAWIVNEPGWS